jgi:hypothetical protein
MQADTEKLSFQVGLSGTYWDRQPEFTIWIDDKQVAHGLAGSEIQVHEFNIDVEDNTSHKLMIRLENKSSSDVVQNENKEIIKDMLLNIDSIVIDDVDITNLLWDHSKFVGDDPSRPILDGCINLGWNGASILELNCPFYLWLLEKM